VAAEVGQVGQVQAGELEQVVSGASEGSGGQLARTSSHYMGPVASDSLAHTWMHHAWADAGHVLNRCPHLASFQYTSLAATQEQSRMRRRCGEKNTHQACRALVTGRHKGNRHCFGVRQRL
jgi:hypothetical protein